MNDVTSDSPFDLFELWYGEALKLPLNTPSSMVLSTVEEGGKPSSRIVLLKQWGEEGFVFYTNFSSRKAKNLATNPNASLLFYWDSLRKQVRIEGTVEKVSREEANAYFKSRPLESQWGAWASRQSEPLEDRSTLEERYFYFQQKYPDQVPLPEFWGGYLLKPGLFEFWENGDYRLHQRLVFEKREAGWISHALYP